MTTIDIIRNKEGLIHAFRIRGHSDYEESGKDIVCSSISTAVMMTIGLIDKLGLTYDYKVEDETATIDFHIQSLTDMATLVIDNFYEHVVALSTEYNPYLKISEKRR
ncbi:MAG: ribosomal-processing cysteine protease Prp [Bacilli bacterium]